VPTPEAALEAFDRFLREQQAERRLPSLSAAVVCRGDVVWADAVGLADVEEERAPTTEDSYMVGSITKTFTAAAIMQLRDAGELDLDDPIGAHLPDAVLSRPTLRRMLAHISGLQREVPGEVWERLEFPDRDGLLRAYDEAEEVLGPGERWHYSNLAYSLLGEVVARRSGQDYERYVEERLLEPVGLRRTTWRRTEPAARGYYVEPWGDAVRREPLVEKGAVAATGALWSTPSDLCRWAAFLAEPDEAVLSRRAAEEMHALQVMADPKGWNLGWGLGLMLFRRGDRILAGHGGATIGFRAGFAYARTEGIGAAALTNASTGMESEVAVELAVQALEALPAAVEPWRPGRPAPAELEPLLGSWWTEGQEVVLRYRDGALQLVHPALPHVEPSVFESDGERDRFRVASGPERGELLRIVRDADGAPTKLYLATYPLRRAPSTFADEAPAG
jgi:CubicO group peptidase (beta-lactamase class C family)